MLPICLSFNNFKTALIGNSELLEERAKKLKMAGCNFDIYNPDGKSEMEAIRKFPSRWRLKKYKVVMAVGLDDKLNSKLFKLANKLNILINIEDVKQYCNFYFAAEVRRGDLIIGINTNGKSPALSVRIRKYLEEIFPEIWQERLNEIGQKRLDWKKEGLSFSEVTKKSNEFFDRNKWFK